MKAKLYINKSNLRYNIEYVKDKTKNKEIIAMIKSNAYGTNSITLAKELIELDVKAFGVATIEEAISLRENNIEGMILVTSVCFDEEIEKAIKNDISLSVSDIENLIEINDIAAKMNKNCKIHLKLDTGMTRLGFKAEELLKYIDKIVELNFIDIEGIYTHLSCADSNINYTKLQINIFEDTLVNLNNKIKFKYIHVLNSDGVEYKYDLKFSTHVRVGMIIYGYTGNTKPILKLTSYILHINSVDKDTRVGYNSTYITKGLEKIAVVKLGYADGLKRCLSNRGTVKVKGIECNIVGNICMDLFMIDVSKVIDVKVKDEVIIFDFDDNLKEMSNECSTIPYEIIACLGERIERVVVE